MHRTPRRRTGGLAALLPALLVLAVLGGAGAGARAGSPGAAVDRAPLVDLTVTGGSR